MDEQTTRYFYLIQDSETPAYPEGDIMIQKDKLATHIALNVPRHTPFETSIMNVKTGDEYTPSFVYLGCRTFESETDYRENGSRVAKQLLRRFNEERDR